VKTVCDLLSIEAAGSLARSLEPRYCSFFRINVAV
jgi:hypothetical protein